MFLNPAGIGDCLEKEEIDQGRYGYGRSGKKEGRV